MAVRTRRVRMLLAAFAVFAIYVFYQRNPATVQRYADYITDNAVGGGAVLRYPGSNAEPKTSSRAGAIAVEKTTSQKVAEAVRTSTKAVPMIALETSTKAAPQPTTTTSTHTPQATPDALPPTPVTAESKWDDYDDSTLSSPLPKPSAAVHWQKQAEQHKIASTARMPTGSAKAIPRIQKRGGSADKEKLRIIKEAAKFSWDGYKNIAWGFDELRPVSGEPKNSFNGWGATLVDSLDTLWIMGMVEEFEEGVEKVLEIDFTTSPRDDIPLFEVNIRYLGGLLAAYDISEHKYSGLLDKAAELAEILYSAFDTPNRMPDTYYHWKPDEAKTNRRAGVDVVMAELGTLSLEFTRLAQLTGKVKFYDAIDRITEEFRVWQNNTRVPGMWPLKLDASGCQKPAQIALNGQGSSQVPGVAIERPLGGSKPPSETSAHSPSLANAPVHKRQLGEWEASDVDFPLADSGSTPQQFIDALPELDATAGTNSEEEVECVPQGLASTSLNSPETFGLGGASDSTYEYLPKEYLLLGGQLDVYKQMYLDSMKAVEDEVLYRPMTKDNLDILISGELHVSRDFETGELEKVLLPKQEHLTCFAGGMFAMGGKIFDLPEHVEIGRKLTEGCIWSYNSTNSGIMPEVFTTVACDSVKSCTWNESKWWDELDPFRMARLALAESEFPKLPTQAGPPPSNMASGVIALPPTQHGMEALYSHEKRQAPGSVSDLSGSDLAAAVLPNPPSSNDAGPPPIQHDTSPLTHTPTTSDDDTQPPLPIFPTPSHRPYRPASHEDFVRQRIHDQHLPPGFVSIIGKNYILRPEAIESVFYMYRITLEPYWREAGWRMFEAIEAATRAEFGYSAIHDVTAPPLSDEAEENGGMRFWQTDLMESFWLAETLKYFYLLFDEPDTWSLDDWVLNTEAHFFRRPGNEVGKGSGSDSGAAVEKEHGRTDGGRVAGAGAVPTAPAGFDMDATTKGGTDAGKIAGAGPGLALDSGKLG